eukprot:4922865-Prymnesium_polylepis.1
MPDTMLILEVEVGETVDRLLDGGVVLEIGPKVAQAVLALHCRQKMLDLHTASHPGFMRRSDERLQLAAEDFDILVCPLWGGRGAAASGTMPRDRKK